MASLPRDSTKADEVTPKEGRHLASFLRRLPTWEPSVGPGPDSHLPRFLVRGHLSQLCGSFLLIRTELVQRTNADTPGRLPTTDFYKPAKS